MGLLSSNIQCCATFFINFEFAIVTKCFKLLNYIINYARYLIGLYLWYTGGQMHRLTVTTNSILLPCYINQIDSMLPIVGTAIDHRWYPNLVR